MSFRINISSILSKELVGKMYRYCIYDKPIMLQYTVTKKKQGATLKQFQDNPERFGFPLVREKKIGRDRKFEESKIIRAWIDSEEYKGHYIMAELENGKILELTIE